MYRHTGRGVMLPGQDTGDRVTVPFSDPSRPKTVKVQLLNGNITVHGYNGQAVVVEARSGSSRRQREREDARNRGMRRIDSGATGLRVEEQDNVVSISAGPPGGVSGLDIQVPYNTSLRLNTHNDKIIVENVAGEIDANSLNGDVRLTGISGAVVAHTQNGEIHVVLDKVMDKPMSFSTLNGDVDVTLPATTRARLKMKSDHGEVYTDFEVKLEPTRGPVTSDERKSGGKYRVQFDKTIYGTINGGGPEMQFTTLNGKIYVRKK